MTGQGIWPDRFWLIRRVIAGLVRHQFISPQKSLVVNGALNVYI